MIILQGRPLEHNFQIPHYFPVAKIDENPVLNNTVKMISHCRINTRKTSVEIWYFFFFFYLFIYCHREHNPFRQHISKVLVRESSFSWPKFYMLARLEPGLCFWICLHNHGYISKFPAFSRLLEFPVFPIGWPPCVSNVL